MGYAIYIRKILEKKNIHYYEVLKDATDLVDYFIGLNPINKQIMIFTRNNFEAPDSIYDLEAAKFIFLDKESASKINGRVMIKGIKAIRENYFPEYISWQS